MRPCWIARHSTITNTAARQMATGMGIALIARFMGPTWGPSGDARTQVGPILAPRTFLSGVIWPALFVTGCTESCHFENSWCNHWRKCHEILFPFQWLSKKSNFVIGQCRAKSIISASYTSCKSGVQVGLANNRHVHAMLHIGFCDFCSTEKQTNSQRLNSWPKTDSDERISPCCYVVYM